MENFKKEATILAKHSLTIYIWV